MKAKNIDFLELVDIRDGMFILTGDRYRAVVTADPVNFSLLTAEEQEAVEGAFGSLLMGLSFPIQIVVLTRPVDMRDCVARLKRDINNFSQEMVKYMAELENFLSHSAVQTCVTESFIVVPYDDRVQDYRKARGELMRRVQYVMEGLSKCGLFPRMLDTVELMQFMAGFLQKDAKVRMKELLSAGALELTKRGVARIEDTVAVEKKG